MALILAVSFSCHGPRPAGKEKGRGKPFYSTRPAAPEAAGCLDRAAKSVKKIYSVASYTTWQFRREDRMTGQRLAAGAYRQNSWGIISTNETVLGTGTVIAASRSRVVLLTCAHVVTAPDTLVTWYESAGDDPVRYIRSFSLKERQENWVKGLPSCGPFEVLAADGEADIALIGQDCERLTDTVEVFPFAPGNAGRLGWGSFLYIVGFPLGNRVITSGMASPAEKRPFGEFTVDALLNKGHSGGLVLALPVRGGCMEMVGMVKSVSSTREAWLKPAPGSLAAPDWIPYTGESFIGSSDHISYGINAVIPIEQIRDFCQRNLGQLRKSGYAIDGFFGPKP